MKSLRWERDTLYLLDQTALPHQERLLACTTAAEVVQAIKDLRVRGAPALGAAAAYGLVLGAREIAATDLEVFLGRLRETAGQLAASRPTAVNLTWALTRMLRAAERAGSVEQARAALLAEAEAIAADDVRANRAIGEFGAAMLRPGEGILTYCNTGALATVDYGTAFGIIRTAHERGLRPRLFACETRPVLQGARLTAWEAVRLGIDVTVITDNAAGALMRRGLVQRVIVGADRIAANGDVANKIGTYTLAVLARAHEIPFIVAAPLSTVDPDAADGDAIPIEERPPEEVTHLAGIRLVPEGVAAMNPAFDITPHHLVTAIVTDAGVATPPYAGTLGRLRAAAVGG
ncbi:MAG: S-methyl-5-thioribose-1-phosphate isomerase [Armatimonadota bacterium]|nr:S-methyl-5-thioribose-1-phosphate isomerase [Armatimonadota bacterium]MDR7451771.1 S-methyl-5-thioribose-1-phosphate isomerase [Armatimonadota bacterium]MDR7467396.1 S-methyl-5-thioribose-1-phosphate isomerase [Armatimonadota bacterium]MDR7494166.1 S-methyl-5-thioribose-1-phosphate isomerase [Armatimonadota bacterium]MDR7498868.1 S-methyl-5-thioribose-1-phosphate isomerase [Armatimonadota bacterium]